MTEVSKVVVSQKIDWLILDLGASDILKRINYVQLKRQKCTFLTHLFFNTSKWSFVWRCLPLTLDAFCPSDKPAGRDLGLGVTCWHCFKTQWEPCSLMFTWLIDSIDILLWKAVWELFNNPAQVMMLNMCSIILLHQVKCCIYFGVLLCMEDCLYLHIYVCLQHVVAYLAFHVRTGMCVCIAGKIPSLNAYFV